LGDPDHRSVRRRIRELWFPVWLATPLTFLGLLFAGLPILGINWFGYFLALGAALVLGLWANWRYRVEIRRPVEGLMLVRIEDRKHYASTREDPSPPEQHSVHP
jgi:hypothetical protein